MYPMTAAPIIRGIDDGERRWFYGGGVHTWKATSAETGGSFLLFEDRMDKGKMTPLHTHPDSDESMYILEGEILMHMDGEKHLVTAGGLVVAPRGVLHAFMVVSDVVRMLCLHTPGACEAFYRDASEPLAVDEERTALSTSISCAPRRRKTAESSCWVRRRSSRASNSPANAVGTGSSRQTHPRPLPCCFSVDGCSVHPTRHVRPGCALASVSPGPRPFSRYPASIGGGSNRDGFARR